MAEAVVVHVHEARRHIRKTWLPAAFSHLCVIYLGPGSIVKTVVA